MTTFSPHTRVQLAARARALQRGFTIVELMVALVLGMVLIIGVINVFVTNQQTFRTNENLGRLQENARISFELMAREVRQAGGNLCGASLMANVLRNATTAWSSNWDAGVLQGFDGAEDATGIVTTGTAVNQRVADTDALLVLSGGMFDGRTIVSHNTATAQITLNTTSHGFAANDIVVVCDGQSAAMAEITAATSAVVTHAIGAGAADNCSRGLGYPTDCATAAGNSRAFQAGGFVTRMSASTWYVGNNPRGGRSLYKIASTGTQEIAEGVRDMQLDYLLRNNATGVMDSNWVAASSITDWTPASNSQVVAVRFKLTLETQASVGTNQQPITRQLIHVVNLRNRPS
ncbi:PilW family protein [Hydrogenophaga sp.]|uniref:PilW family protein n=1 Tax=Hydrogenophaga sp. TaxID=1904254 RepID=UPI002727EF08|nr:PilW family protein [Hydrogenophaga sp.]MDO9434347.1 prepilin-type N-terminal cleavage/methylation domain-containing protein [Hydrogenophaga sp.]